MGPFIHASRSINNTNQTPVCCLFRLQYPAGSGRSVEHQNLSSLGADQLRMILPQAELGVLPAIMPLCMTSASGTRATASNAGVACLLCIKCGVG